MLELDDNGLWRNNTSSPSHSWVENLSFRAGVGHICLWAKYNQYFWIKVFQIHTYSFPYALPMSYFVLYCHGWVVATKNVCIMCAKSLQSCPTLWDPMDCSLPASSALGILQARTLEWVAMPLSRGPSQPGDGTGVSWIACGFFSVWATKEDLKSMQPKTFTAEKTSACRENVVTSNVKGLPGRLLY